MRKKVDVVRAWKEAGYRESLGSDEQALIPANPAGMVELTDEDLEYVVGGLAACTQTGTGGGCYCMKTKTADSGEGTCYCTCETSIAPDDAPAETRA